MMARVTKARIMTVLMAATVAGGLLTGDAQARGGGGGHGGGGHGGGGFGGAVGGFGGTHMGGFGGAHMGGFGRAATGGLGHHHRYGAYSPRYGYGYGDGACSLYGWQYGQQWPDACY
jgi:hypothetical protein